MGAAVLALGVGALTVSGCVWYVPALVDLRAGADRPVSRRLAAASCVTGWATAAVLVPLLLLGTPVRPLLALAAAGVGGGAALHVRAAARRRYERRETASCWAALDPPTPPPTPFRRRTATLRWAGAGLLAAVLMVTLVMVRSLLA
ncbi:hypothetical protein ACIRQY_35165 [Streptomyces sp. NPDC101490]|uniref:hypothetical protein n=1 Tax=Streptomyces sp. NPDC101490 TaxID=3366143 RepID=UPI00380F752F